MKILFVEDDFYLREIFTEKLREHFPGIVDVAQSGNVAIKFLQTENSYDIIISDYDMDNGSGIDLLNFKIKNKLKMPFVFFTHTIQPEVPFPLNEYTIVDKNYFDILCEEIERLVKSSKNNYDV
jgi:CheY-like chemotaxis protein